MDKLFEESRTRLAFKMMEAFKKGGNGVPRHLKRQDTMLKLFAKDYDYTFEEHIKTMLEVYRFTTKKDYQKVIAEHITWLFEELIG